MAHAPTPNHGLSLETRLLLLLVFWDEVNHDGGRRRRHWPLWPSHLWSFPGITDSCPSPLQAAGQASITRHLGL